jgi:hypothetical protein
VSERSLLILVSMKVMKVMIACSGSVAIASGVG